MARPRRSAATAGATTLRLKPADPFELIRWLARSQSDPRKAVAELVQNSLDAQAKVIVVRRHRVRGAVCLSILDDGEGVLPDLDRRAALEYLATHVGHSRKMGLDPATRMQQVVAGQYGVGLLGFWSIGRRLEMRTRVAGSDVLALRLEEDSARAEIAPLPQTIGADATFTEVSVIGIHEAAQKALSGRRLADYLAAELRGQLLRRDVAMEVHDDVARGMAQRRFHVVPKRFMGEQLALPAEIHVADGLPLARVELYLARGAERPAIQIACAGTLVTDDVAHLEALGLAQKPWVGRDLLGIIDFPGFHVPPGTRRGVMPDAAAAAFAGAMDRLSPLVEAELARLDQERTAAVDRDVVRELKRALRGFQRRLPRYDLPHVAAAEAERDGDAGEGEPLRGGGGAAGSEPGDAEIPLFPVGPLAAVRITPPAIRVAPGAERRVRARAVDADGRAVEGVEYAWRVVDEGGAGVALEGEGAHPAVAAGPGAPIGVRAVLRVEARQGARRAEAEAVVEVAEDARDGEALGVPEPNLVSDPDGAWRSRLVGDRWEVNDGHEDYRALRGDGRARLRYLLALLAKEIVLRTTGRVDTADVMESMVEVLAHAERNLRGA